jgi:Holliday junction DNA helicase RuvB
MTQEETEVQNAVLTLLSHDAEGSMKRVLESIMEWEKAHPLNAEKPSGFEWHMVFADARTLNSLVTRRILRVVFKSNKYCEYRALDASGIEKALADFEGTFTQEAALEGEALPPDLFSVIIGHSDKKEILNRSLRAVRPVHCLLYGSPASAKSLMLEELARLPRSRFVLGSALTRAGLLDVLFNERPRYLIMDEIEKISTTEDLAALLSLMQSGIVTETKWKRHRTLRLTTWVMASANDIMRLPRELLSRFLLLHFKDYTDDEFYEVSVNVLKQREGINENLAVYIAEKVLTQLNSRDVRDCVKAARLLKDHSKEEVDKIVELLRKQR